MGEVPWGPFGRRSEAGAGSSLGGNDRFDSPRSVREGARHSLSGCAAREFLFSLEGCERDSRLNLVVFLSVDPVAAQQEVAEEAQCQRDDDSDISGGPDPVFSAN